MVTCLDLRIGGTLSSGGISGGVSIQQEAHGIEVHTGIGSHPGFQARGVRVIGRPGLVIPETNQAQEALVTLQMLVTGTPLAGETLDPSGSCYELDLNTDRLMAYFADDQGFYIERDLADGSSRFIYCHALDSFPISTPQPLVRQFTAILTAGYPWWQAGGTEDTLVVSGATTLTNNGTAPIQNAVLSFAGDGTIGNSTTGQSVQISGSAGTVTVDLLTGAVTQGGSPADNLLIASDSELMRFVRGSNTITHSGATVTVTYRDSFNS